MPELIPNVNHTLQQQFDKARLKPPIRRNSIETIKNKRTSETPNE